MSLSMDEQRMLAEIERRLSAEDPRLAAKLSAFRRPGRSSRLRSPRGRIVGSLLTVALVAAISMMVYAMVPFRAHGLKPATTPQASSTSAQFRPAASAGTSASTQTGAGTAISQPKTSVSKTPTMRSSRR
jgi:hypothetical protein